MNRYRHLFVILALTGLFLWFSSKQPKGKPEAEGPPRLVLQITVDQLRADLPFRHASQFGLGGFRYLMDEGLVYIDATHQHANTETIVGHTTLATGAHPASHGMIGNVWFDRSSGQLTYNVEDPEHPLLTAGAGVDAKTEIDPTQRVARSDGRSPKRILTSTFGDELALFHAGRSKVFGVSVKDRGAIAMAGHAGKAFWFSKKSAAFVTSSFYYDAMPAWVDAWNAEQRPLRYAGTTWELSRDPGSYLFGDRDDRPFELDLAGFGRTFPHQYGPADDKYFTTQLTVSPAGDDLTLEFAEALIENEQLGQDDVPDFLSISFSATDYVGHLFGPSSLESEENILQLDRRLARLFQFIDAKVGLDRTLIVLSADHGGPDAPGHLKEYGFDVDYVDDSKFEQTPAVVALKKRLGIDKKILSAFFPPYLYLDREHIAGLGLDPVIVERDLAHALSQAEGVALAVSGHALTTGGVPDTPLVRRVVRNHNPRRSGDIYLVFEPGWFINDFDGLRVAVHHGSPWSYDRHVPSMVAGAGVRPTRVVRPVHTTDIAGTLSLLFGAKLPSGFDGTPLHEVFEARRR
ncbi:MAG: alkaline phosphatase family protein [Planctomycetota bacterium]|nr:alkaline phosphatase family protein [Planctomycetota bacterium]